ncbi:hypothetical protein PHLCEN_2v7774 [Hermanssonia centrifuga]|uniref:Uncharacterized protein n=1 Tax=Hermanssonia centrifuga TaxID=98765 RepID=A0A2R6NVH2_9APHY|nr:hypothetical protein PHLCEN_2v7774 [Hermanssonia centrifuga]
MDGSGKRGEGVERFNLWESKGRKAGASRGHSSPSKDGEDLKATNNMFRMNGAPDKMAIELTETAPKYRKTV